MHEEAIRSWWDKRDTPTKVLLLLVAPALVGSGVALGQLNRDKEATESSQTCLEFSVSPDGTTAAARIEDHGLNGALNPGTVTDSSGFFVREGGCRSVEPDSVYMTFGGIVCKVVAGPSPQDTVASCAATILSYSIPNGTLMPPRQD